MLRPDRRAGGPEEHLQRGDMRGTATISVTAALALAMAEPAAAHHVMGGVMPTTAMQGLMSGLGHPVIGLDHFAAVVAVGCLSAAPRPAGPLVGRFRLGVAGAAPRPVQRAAV